jgi:hypothetical protein
LFKNLAFILFFIFVVSGSLSGKEASDSTKSRTKISIGIQGGLYLSNLHAPRTNPNGPPFGYSYYEVEDNGATAGLSTGFFLDFKGASNFSLQPEINFMWFRHTSKLVAVRPYLRSVANYNYELSYFNMQLCLLPKLSFGKKSHVKLMAGPVLRIPLVIRNNGEKIDKSDETLQASPGGIACLRFDVPVNPGLLGFEIRAGSDFFTGEYTFKETSITLGLSYVF